MPLSQNRNATEIPIDKVVSMEEAEEKAIRELKLSSDKRKAQCQSCGIWLLRIRDVSPERDSTEIRRLKRTIKHLEEYAASTCTRVNCKAEKEQLDQLLKEQERLRFLRSLPLKGNACTGYRLYCSTCWNQAYEFSYIKKR